MKVAIYLRFGSESQIINDDPTILEILRDIQQYCQSKGWIKANDYIVEAIKAKL